MVGLSTAKPRKLKDYGRAKILGRILTQLGSILLYIQDSGEIITDHNEIRVFSVLVLVRNDYNIDSQNYLINLV